MPLSDTSRTFPNPAGSGFQRGTVPKAPACMTGRMVLMAAPPPSLCQDPPLRPRQCSASTTVELDNGFKALELTPRQALVAGQWAEMLLENLDVPDSADIKESPAGLVFLRVPSRPAEQCYVAGHRFAQRLRRYRQLPVFLILDTQEPPFLHRLN